jgi:hypothetical protein
VINMSFIVITYDPSFNAFLMLTIDQFLTIVRLPFRQPQGGSHGRAQHSQRSYSDHDTQECGAAGFGRDDIDGERGWVHEPCCWELPRGSGNLCRAGRENRLVGVAGFLGQSGDPVAEP